MRGQEEQREEQTVLERRCLLLVSEGEETRGALENADRQRKTLEIELTETNEKYNDLNNQVEYRLQHLLFSVLSIINQIKLA